MPENQKLEIKLGLKISKPLHDVFEAIVDPAKMSNYFIANEEGIKWLKCNTEGWANFLACLKAYLEYGINLRKGAFDISQMATKNEVA
jgi:uncharacterized protein YndB with AHSA1/START domain